ncbi:MAG TPA: nucleotidyltransferase domain-containing protein [Puia sp.]|nr:nucleotidyltransferase domain-containing protein [Puia sp.]
MRNCCRLIYLYNMTLSPNDKRLLQSYFVGKPIKKAYLFGSYARNQAGGGSDIDILVELDHTHPIGMKIFRIQAELEDLMKRKVDLVSLEGISKYIKPLIDKDKILIYDRSVVG